MEEITLIAGGMILLVCGILFIAVAGHTIYQIVLYGGREVYCQEDTGVNFRATISPSMWDTLIYFNYEDSLKFKGTDGKIYFCRGTAELK